jgi:GntR family transcriptional regulator
MPLPALELRYDAGIPVYRQICDAVLLALARGDLQRDEQLPTIHELARQLDVNPNTVVRAYQELERGGHVVAERGRGTFAAAATRPPKATRESLLRRIVERALGECSRHGLDEQDLFEYLRRKTS